MDHYATSRQRHGPYTYRGLVGCGWALDAPNAHGAFFVWRGDWYHGWCRYRDRSRDRSRDRIRNSCIAPIACDEVGSVRTDVSALAGLDRRDDRAVAAARSLRRDPSLPESVCA